MAQADFTRIATNIGALNALYSLRSINNRLGIHQLRLATGKRINSAEDDPAGLTIATKMLARSEGLKVALDNIGDAKNLLSVAEGSYGRITDILIQMRNKAEAAASDTLGESERAAIKEQLLSYATQIDDIVAQTKWNDRELINGDFAEGVGVLTFQTGPDRGDVTTLTGLQDVGAVSLNIVDVAAASAVSDVVDGDSLLGTEGIELATVFDGFSELSSGNYKLVVSALNDGESATIQLVDASNNPVYVSADGGATKGLFATFEYDNVAGNVVDLGVGIQVNIADGLTGGSGGEITFTYTKKGTRSVDANSAAEFGAYMDRVQTALDTVSSQFSKVGALMGRLTFKEDQVSIAQINVEASYNRIMNADMAREQVEATKMSILQQTAIAMLSQANMQPQAILSLFR